MKEKGRKKTERKEKIDKGERYEKQGIGEQGDGEKLRKRREKMRGESFNKMKAKSDEKNVRKNERLKNEKH